MMIADQCRSLAARYYAASLSPWTPYARRSEMAEAAECQEAKAKTIEEANVPIVATSTAQIEGIGAVLS